MAERNEEDETKGWVCSVQRFENSGTSSIPSDIHHVLGCTPPSSREASIPSKSEIYLS